MPDPVGRYIDYAFVTKLWGDKAVTAWADTDGDGQRGPADDAVIAEAIADAEDDIDAGLATAYSVPFVGQVPRMVRKLARLRVGVYLYARRGLREGADPAGQMHAWWDITDRLMADLRAGRLNLPGVPRRPGVAHRPATSQLSRGALPF